MFYSVIETRDFSLFNQSAQALLKGYFINSYINARGNWENSQFLVFPISTRVDITVYQLINTENVLYLLIITYKCTGQP